MGGEWTHWKHISHLSFGCGGKEEEEGKVMGEKMKEKEEKKSIYIQQETTLSIHALSDYLGTREIYLFI